MEYGLLGHVAGIEVCINLKSKKKKKKRHLMLEKEGFSQILLYNNRKDRSFYMRLW